MRSNKYVLICFLLILFSGCQNIKQGNLADNLSLKDSATNFKRMIIGRSVENNPIESIIIGNGDRVILILASIHGDEIVGKLLLNNLTHFLQSNPEFIEGRKVILLPEVNPDGVLAYTRHNARNIDLNRNFPASNCPDPQCSGKYGLPEPETEAVIRVIELFKPERIISIHEPLDCIDYDGPAEEIAGHLANYTNLPVRKLGAKPGSLGSYAGEDKGIPVITLELPGNVKSLLMETQWEIYGNALIASIVFPSYFTDNVIDRKITKKTIDNSIKKVILHKN